MHTGHVYQKLIVMTLAVGVTLALFLGLSVWISQYFGPPVDDGTIFIFSTGIEDDCGFEFTGKIVNKIGTPISNAQVSILDDDHLINTFANRDGKFTLTNDLDSCGQAETRLPLSVTALGYKPATFVLDLKQKEAQFTLYERDL